jgi:hypothetical protein
MNMSMTRGTANFAGRRVTALVHIVRSSGTGTVTATVSVSGAGLPRTAPVRIRRLGGMSSRRLCRQM